MKSVRFMLALRVSLILPSIAQQHGRRLKRVRVAEDADTSDAAGSGSERGGSVIRRDAAEGEERERPKGMGGFVQFVESNGCAVGEF